MTIEHKDLAGNPLNPGMYVVYAAAFARSPILKYGLVTRLAEAKDGRERITPTIRVITVDLSHYMSGPEWSRQKDGQEIALGHLDRVLVVSGHLLPNVAREMLDKAYAARLAKHAR